MQSGLVVAEPTDDGSRPVEESPLEAFFRASDWSRSDAVLALWVLEVGLLAALIIIELRQ